MVDEKVLQEELAVLQADFDKTKKGNRNYGEELGGQKSNLNCYLWCFTTN